MSETKKAPSKEEDPLSKLAKAIKSLEEKVTQSEVRTASKIDKKIDGLAATLGARLDKTEAGLLILNVNLAQAQSDIEDVREMASTDRIKKLVEEALASGDRVGAPPGRRPRMNARTTTHPRDKDKEDGRRQGDSEMAKEERYWIARRQLRLWPVLWTAELDSGVRAFLRDKLCMVPAAIDALNFDITPLTARTDSLAQNQVLVTFTTVRERDDVRAKANNLRGGDRTVGCQLEPPDHLLAHYKAFQNLAYCLKKKSPGLKRNVKFNDGEQTLVMDIRREDEWKTVHYATARGLLRLKTQGTDAISRKQLRDFLSKSDVADDDTDDENDNNMDVDETNTNKDKRSPHSVSFINTNARSLQEKDVLQPTMDTSMEAWLLSIEYRRPNSKTFL